MRNLSDLELQNIKDEAESAEAILSRAIEIAEEKKSKISAIIEKIDDEQYRREEGRAF